MAGRSPSTNRRSLHRNDRGIHGFYSSSAFLGVAVAAMGAQGTRSFFPTVSCKSQGVPFFGTPLRNRQQKDGFKSRPNYAALDSIFLLSFCSICTGILRPASCAGSGTWISRTPFSYRAAILSVSTPWGKASDRSNFP